MGLIHANTDALARMSEGDPDEPVIMLNLLKYREMAEPGQGVDGLSGRAAYEIYGRKFADLYPRFGGEPQWMGQALNHIIGNEGWDLVVLVRYPTRKQFVDMLNDSDYQAIAPIRAAALLDSRLIETRPLLR